MKNIFFLMMAFFSYSGVHADHIDCGYNEVEALYTQSSRSDGSTDANKLLVVIGGVCPTLGYLENTDPAFDSIFSMLLAAKMSGSKIRIVVSDSISNNRSKIEFVNLL